MRIAQAQVVVTAEMDTEDGHRVTVRQSTEAEEELAKIYSLLEVNPNPIGKVKSMVHPKAPPKNPPPENQGVMQDLAAMRVNEKRKQFPNAYKPWSTEDDKLLVT